LIIVTGWLGDALFASSVAKKLKEEKQFEYIDYLIGFPQTYHILNNNPYIDDVFVSNTTGPYPSTSADDFISKYDVIYTLPENDFLFPPLTYYFQKYCGVITPSTEFKVYTLEDFDDLVLSQDIIKKDKLNIGVCLTWKNGFNPEKLLQELSEYYNVIPLGVNKSQYESVDDIEYYCYTASLCKYCDYVIGSEGGMTNLAAGVGTKVIYTTDFIYSYIGPNGSKVRFDDPISIMGPIANFPNSGHIALDPNVRYEDLSQIIKTTIDEDLLQNK
jgi:ADP-heptose:LPS heptosyltransferase